MRRVSVASFMVIAAAGFILTTGANPRAQADLGVSLKMSKEFVPPGAIAQMKVSVTEPKPISTARARFNFQSFASLEGIAVNSPANDTFGVAVVRDGGVEASVVSATGSFGLGLDYPVLSFAARVPATLPIGRRLPAEMDPSALRFFDLLGALYPVEFKDGFAETVRGVSIDDVRPGSADLPAGSTVTIFGKGFVPRTEIKFDEVKLSATRFVSASRIDVVLARAARMHGRRIRAINPDGNKVTYFSYQRTSSLTPSFMPVFDNAVPLFPGVSASTATIRLRGANRGVAFQNIATPVATVVARLYGPQQALLATRVISLPINRYIVREVTELFETFTPPGAYVVVTANGPVQAMGIAVNSAGAAAPVPAQ